MEGHDQEEDEVPEEIEDQCVECHHALASVERLLKPLLATSHGAVEEKASCHVNPAYSSPHLEISVEVLIQLLHTILLYSTQPVKFWLDLFLFFNV